MNAASTAIKPLAKSPWRMAAGRLIAAIAGPLVGFGLLLIIWKIISMRIGDIPAPELTLLAAVDLFKNPFYNNGPNDVGIGWNILASLGRVGIGFLLAAFVGIPIGFLIGRVPAINAICAPVINLLRPVSPLAWLPLGLLLFKAADPAAIWAIFICSIWPMIINTADGVKRVPDDYLNVARVLNLSEWKVFTRILLPSVLPYMMTGVRLSIGTAWLVIVAAEMLTGGTGLGFWLWDEWNSLNVQNILIAVLVIGVIGLALDLGLLALARRLNYSEA